MRQYQLVFLNRSVLPARRNDEVSEIRNKLGTGELEQVQARLSWSQLQKGRRPPADLQNLKSIIDDDARRRVFLNRNTIRLPFHILKGYRTRDLALCGAGAHQDNDSPETQIGGEP